MIAWRKRIMIAIALCVLLNCIASQKITLEYKDLSFTFGQIKQGVSVKVVVADNVDLRDFQNSFEKEYQSDQAFISILSRQIADSVKALLGGNAVPADNSQDAATLADAGIDKTAVNRIQELLGNTNADYYCVVNTVTIANRRVTTAPMPMAGPASTRIPGGSSETAMVTLHVDIWNIKEKKKVLLYAAMGESPVTLMFYGTALKNAVNDAVGNMVRYLATGENR
jgi:hypothetical protein